MTTILLAAALTQTPTPAEVFHAARVALESCEQAAGACALERWDFERTAIAASEAERRTETARYKYPLPVKRRRWWQLWVSRKGK